MAEAILKENRGYLDKLAANTRLDSNSRVNKSFKWIDIFARRRDPDRQSRSRPIEETCGRPQ